MYEEEQDQPQPGHLRSFVIPKQVPPRARCCENCPFVIGSSLEMSLTPARKSDFKNEATHGYFPCHKTTAKRMALMETHHGEGTPTEWDFLPLEERLKIAAKEQECVGARIWREHGRHPNPDEIDP